MKRWIPIVAAAGFLTATVALAAPPPITQEQLLELQAGKDPELLVLDVRSPEEYAAGHVPGAVNVPYDQVAARLAEIPKDKDVVLYCRSGRRTGIAAEVLESNGYTRLRRLQGDLEAWMKAGRPIEAAARKPAG